MALHRAWLSIFIVGVLCGCAEKVVADLSDDPAYKPYIGASYEIVGKVEAYGIKTNLNEGVDTITLIPPPGIDGPEVGFVTPIKPGSTIRVLKVLKTNRWPDPDITLLVALDGNRMPVTTAITVDLFRGNEGAGRVLLNPHLYRRILP